MRKITTLVILLTTSLTSMGQVELKKDSIEKFAYHIQQTLVGQSASDKGLTNLQKSGTLGQNEYGNAFNDANLKVSLSATFYLGWHLWKNGSIYINPDIAGGSGLGGTVGVAGYVNGEIFRVGNPSPSPYISRAFIRQYIPLSKDYYYQEGSANQLGEMIPTKRLQFTIGKFTLADMFDCNHYSHDPRTRFLNWSLMNAGAYDFASNTKGYTYGAVVEYITPKFSARAGIGEHPQYSNGPLNLKRSAAMMDMESEIFKNGNKKDSIGYGLNFEIEKPFKLKSEKSSIIRILFFINNVDAGKYTDAMDYVKIHGSDTSFVNNAPTAMYMVRKAHAIKYGFSLNLEQPIGKHAGMFSRLSWNDGKTESFAFAEIDRSASVGFVLHGTAYHRYHDRIELAGVVNGLSKEHRFYLESGEVGFMLGEPGLKYSPEYIFEFQYVYDLGKNFMASPDYQFIINPGYDMNRSPIHVFGIRTHIEF